MKIDDNKLAIFISCNLALENKILSKLKKLKKRPKIYSIFPHSKNYFLNIKEADMQIKKINNEVFYIKDKISFFDKKMFNFLISHSKKNLSGKCRICFHKNPKSSLHEMIIIHSKKSYVPPHKHLKNAEIS